MFVNLHLEKLIIISFDSDLTNGIYSGTLILFHTDLLKLMTLKSSFLKSIIVIPTLQHEHF